MENKLYLIYVERVNDTPNAMGLYEYEFYFSENPDTAWGTDWNQQCPSACDIENLRPDTSTYNHIERLFSIIPLKAVQENSCFSIQDCIDKCVAILYEDISDYEEYPEPIRLVFEFGETQESVEDKLAQRHQFFSHRNNSIKNNKEDGE